MRSALESTLPWWIAGPLIGLVIVALLVLANKRFGVVDGVTDLVHGSAEGRGLRSWRTLLVLGMVLGGAVSALLAGAPDPSRAYSWLDAHLSAGGEVGVLFGAGLLIGVGRAQRRRLHLWRPSRPRRAHVIGSVLFGIGWGITDACPGPTAAQLGGGGHLRSRSLQASSSAWGSSRGSLDFRSS